MNVTISHQLYDAWQRVLDNATTVDGALGNYKVGEIFENWDQAGYPVLYVTRSYNDHRVRFTQVRENTFFFIRKIYAFIIVAVSRIDFQVLTNIRINCGFCR
jgi:hypothetical protein